MKGLQVTVASVFMLLGVLGSRGETIQITAVPQSAFVGQLVMANIVASGFNSGGAPSIGAYDLVVSFDPTVLSFVSASFGSGLDILGLGDVQSMTLGNGTVELFELSLDSAADLNALQPDTFSLVGLSLQAIGTGTSQLTLTANAVSDADGNDLPVSLEGGSVQVGINPPPSAVTPEPPSMLLCASGVLMMVICAMRKNGFWKLVLKF